LAIFFAKFAKSSIEMGEKIAAKFQKGTKWGKNNKKKKKKRKKVFE
jgi:hypothetical protein